MAGGDPDEDEDEEDDAGGGAWSAQIPSEVPTEITRAAYLKGADIQGIDWAALPITRAKYRETRNTEYASYRNTDTQVDPADKLAQFDTAKHMFQFEYTKLSTKSSFAHFQLRNLVWAPTKNDVFYTHDAIVRHWQPLTRASRTFLDCFSDPRATPRGPVRLSSMCAAEGVLVAGGYLGEYIIKPLDDARLPPVAGIVTSDPNGISNQIEVCRARTGGAIGAVVASNDSKVRRMEVETRKIMQTLELGWPVNCAVQSPNRSMLAVVGDSTETRIFDAVHGDEIMQLHGHVDFSFAAAWSPTSPLLATGNQDRTTRIYDLRFPTRTLHTLKSSIGAVRSLRYAADGTLAIAEDADYVHLLCPRMQQMQSLDFFGEISGIAFTPDDMGDRLFIGNADEAYGSLLEYSRVRRAGAGAGGWWGGWEEVQDEKVGGDEDEAALRAGRDDLRMRYSIQGGTPGQYVEVDWGSFGDMFDIGMAGAELV
ncbi:WD40-repeat-containing domain protein [Catenaria anguillulae PL171]|uniref:WD40-repeat-containing domain protein n=1 Tax=Catenaria anguillulae PL171 TaxID=765915 RepID=A0A1Y2I1D0_9FUNG|nr:WD40-repeat-containing domain protein [Catenaria anguillulae PL171]